MLETVGVGHWTDPVGKTGCTVVVLPPGTVASGEIRGGAPASREFALLDPSCLVSTIDAVVLSGGSAFGLSAADGVMAGLEEAGRGFATRSGNVPIVVGLSLFDLSVGDASARPGPEQGRQAFEQALAAIDGPETLLSETSLAVPGVGAGTGATVDKWSGNPKPGGLVLAAENQGEIVVAALVAVNAFGRIDGGVTTDDPGRPEPFFDSDDHRAGTNTTIGVVVTNAQIDKAGCYLLAQSGHDGLARSLYPAHTLADGDGLVAAATGEVAIEPRDIFSLRVLAQNAVTRAVRSLSLESGQLA